MAGHAELVRIGDVEFFVEVADGGGPKPVGANRTLSFDDVRDTVGAIAEQFAQIWHTVRPHEAQVEFGLNATAKTGKLTGLLVEGGASAALKITLTWRSDPAANQAPESPEAGSGGSSESAGAQPSEGETGPG